MFTLCFDEHSGEVALNNPAHLISIQQGRDTASLKGQSTEFTHQVHFTRHGYGVSQIHTNYMYVLNM